METTNNSYRLVPGFSNSFGTGWQVMKDNFLRLFLVIIVLAIATAPFKANFHLDNSDFKNIPFGLGYNVGENLQQILTIGVLGMFAAVAGFIAMLYTFLVAPVFNYGSDMIFVQAVRRTKPDFELLIKGFMKNYLTIVLANLLVVALVLIGLFILIIPGIIIACRLVFVSYIVMDKKLDPIESVELSWKLTKGHGWQIFFMGIASFFILIFGLMLLIIGIFPAMMWISSSFASLYESVLREKEPAAEIPSI